MLLVEEEDPFLDLLSVEVPMFPEDELSSIPSSPSAFSPSVSGEEEIFPFEMMVRMEDEKLSRKKAPLMEEMSTSSTENVRPVQKKKNSGAGSSKKRARAPEKTKGSRKNRKYNTEAERLEARKKRNRVSAERSRQRRIAYTKSLEEKNEALVAKNERLEAELKELRALVNQLVSPKEKGLGNYSVNMSNPLSSSERTVLLFYYLRKLERIRRKKECSRVPLLRV